MTGAKLGADRYLDLMGHDKKVIAGRLRLVLLKRIGRSRHLCGRPRRTTSAPP